jgi:hypothetical protein
MLLRTLCSKRRELQDPVSAFFDLGEQGLLSPRPVADLGC